MKRKWKNYIEKLNLSRKTRLFFLTIFCLNVLFIVIFVGYGLADIQEYSLENDLKLTRSSVGVMDAEIDNMNGVSKLLVGDKSIRQYLNASGTEATEYASEVQTSIYNYIALYDNISSVYLFRDDGQSVNAQINMSVLNTDITDGKVWKSQMNRKKGQAVIKYNGDGAFALKNEEPLLSHMRAVYDTESQKHTGYLVINIKQDVCENAFEQIISDKDSSVYIADAKGNIYLEKNGGKKLYDQADITRKICKKTIWKQGKKYSFIQIKIPKNDMIVSVLKPQKYMISHYGGFAVLLLIYIGMSVCCWIILHHYLKRRITQPIEKLVDSMDQVHSGWLRRASFPTYEDEIGRLKDGYNDMIIEINHLLNDIQQKESEKYELEVHILQEQIKPHFLYNTLYTIEYMALKNNDKETYESLQTLGSFYRKFLSKGNQEITVAEEVRIASDYLKLQGLRYSEIFETNIEVDKEIESCYVLKLILQPLVENCIYHGIRPKGELCEINIRVERKEEFVYFYVKDTGVGMSEEQIQAILEQHDKKSFGLRATVERLKLFYNREDVCEIHSEEGEYTEIIIKIPMRKVRQDEKKDPGNVS